MPLTPNRHSPFNSLLSLRRIFRQILAPLQWPLHNLPSSFAHPTVSLFKKCRYKSSNNTSVVRTTNNRNGVILETKSVSVTGRNCRELEPHRRVSVCDGKTPSAVGKTNILHALEVFLLSQSVSNDANSSFWASIFLGPDCVPLSMASLSRKWSTNRLSILMRRALIPSSNLCAPRLAQTRATSSIHD